MQNKIMCDTHLIFYKNKYTQAIQRNKTIKIIHVFLKLTFFTHQTRFDPPGPYAFNRLINKDALSLFPPIYLTLPVLLCCAPARQDFHFDRASPRAFVTRATASLHRFWEWGEYPLHFHKKPDAQRHTNPADGNQRCAVPVCSRYPVISSIFIASHSVLQRERW